MQWKIQVEERMWNFQGKVHMDSPRHTRQGWKQVVKQDKCILSWPLMLTLHNWEDHAQRDQHDTPKFIKKTQKKQYDEELHHILEVWRTIKKRVDQGMDMEIWNG